VIFLCQLEATLLEDEDEFPESTLPFLVVHYFFPGFVLFITITPIAKNSKASEPFRIASYIRHNAQ
jgi:hypothetical protein